MKKLMAMLIIIAMAISVVPGFIITSAETSIISEDFEKGDSILTEKDTWARGSYGNLKALLSIATSGDKVAVESGKLVFDLKKASTRNIAKPTAIQVEGNFTYKVVIIEYDLQITNLDASYSSKLFSLHYLKSYEDTAAIQLNKGKLRPIGPDGLKYEVVVEDGKTYKMKFEINNTTNTYKWIVNDNVIGEQVKFVKNNESFQRIHFWNAGTLTNDMKIMIDNFKLYTPGASEPAELKGNPDNSAPSTDAVIKERLKNAVVMSLNVPFAFINNERKFIDNDNKTAPFVVEGRTLVPVRYIAEAFGAKIDWIKETGTVRANFSDKKIELKIGSNEINVNGNINKIDVPANIYNGRTFIPLRAMVEAIGKKVFWDDRGLIIISDNKDIFDPQKESFLIDHTKGLFVK